MQTASTPSTDQPPLRGLVERLAESERWSEERLRASQLRQLRVLLAHAVRHSPFHRERLGLSADQAARIDWEQWRRLPTLARVDLQQQADRIVVENLPAGHGSIHWHSTTGSTGRPLRVAASSFSHFVNGALTVRDHRWHGRDAGARLAVARSHPQYEGDHPTWGAPMAGIEPTGKLRVIDVKRSVEDQLARLLEFDPHYLLTLASNAHALATLAIERDVTLHSLREVRVFGELPRAGLAARCRRAFGAACSDVYSAEETGPISAQCPEQTRHHVHAEALLLEILDADDRVCAPGELGRVVVTPLYNFATPLLRYELGDYAAFGTACRCGRGLPVLGRIAGRRRNMIRLPDGTRHWPSFPAEVWLPFPAIRRVQLAQTALDTVEVRMETDRDLAADEHQRLCASLRERLGWPLTLDLRRVERIGRADDHKFEDFICLVEQAP